MIKTILARFTLDSMSINKNAGRRLREQLPQHISAILSEPIDGVISNRKGHKRWEYDIAVETENLVFELIAPLEYYGTVRIGEFINPTDYDRFALSTIVESGYTVFRGKLDQPQVGSIYAIRWS